jgi:hypothetical protein
MLRIPTTRVPACEKIRNMHAHDDVMDGKPPDVQVAPTSLINSLETLLAMCRIIPVRVKARAAVEKDSEDQWLA